MKFLSAGISTQNWVSFTLKKYKRLEGAVTLWFIGKVRDFFHFRKQKPVPREGFCLSGAAVKLILFKSKTILIR